MSGHRTLVWLPGAGEAAEVVAAQQRDLHGRCTLVTLSVRELLPPGRPDLDAAAATVQRRLGLRPSPLYGAGVGALVALHLAARNPGVSWVALRRGAGEELPTVRSVWSAARRLLPAGALPALGIRRDRMLEVLDQTRVVDVRAIAARVRCPVWVLCGAEDRAELPRSQALARRLPGGELLLVPGAGPRWTLDTPHRVGEMLRRLVEQAT